MLGKMLLLLFMVGFTLAMSGDLWAGIVVAVSMCLVWLSLYLVVRTEKERVK